MRLTSLPLTTFAFCFAAACGDGADDAVGDDGAGVSLDDVPGDSVSSEAPSLPATGQATSGGQTGAEGQATELAEGCFAEPPSMIDPGLVTSAGFSGADVIAAFAGPTTETWTWSDGEAIDATLTIEARAGDVLWRQTDGDAEPCSLMQVPATLGLVTADGQLDESWAILLTVTELASANLVVAEPIATFNGAFDPAGYDSFSLDLVFTNSDVDSGGDAGLGAEGEFLGFIAGEPLEPGQLAPVEAVVLAEIGDGSPVQVEAESE